MVSINKMVQLNSRLVQLILLFLFCELVFACSGRHQYSNIRADQEDKGEILLFLINVVIHKVGKKLDKGYRCPVYCEVHHKHIYWENNEAEKSNIPPDDGIPRPGKPEDREQSEGDLRSIASTS